MRRLPKLLKDHTKQILVSNPLSNLLRKLSTISRSAARYFDSLPIGFESKSMTFTIAPVVPVDEGRRMMKIEQSLNVAERRNAMRRRRSRSAVRGSEFCGRDLSSSQRSAEVVHSAAVG